MAEKLSLGGREYVRAGVGTVRQDLFVMHHARHSGISAIQENETPESYAARLLDSLLSSNHALLLLGGLLLPAGMKAEDWSEDVAYATAGHLGGIVDPAEKQEVYAEVASALLDFFANGIGSWVASARSSGSAPGPKVENSTDDTASGADSSAPSRTTTTTRRGGFWRGLWRRLSSRSGATAAARTRGTTSTVS